MIICVHINGAFGQINACLPQWTTLKTIRTTIRVFLTPLFITDSTSRPIWLDDGCGVDGVQSDVASHQEVAGLDGREQINEKYSAITKLLHFNACKNEQEHTYNVKSFMFIVHLCHTSNCLFDPLPPSILVALGAAWSSSFTASTLKHLRRQF